MIIEHLAVPGVKCMLPRRWDGPTLDNDRNLRRGGEDLRVIYAKPPAPVDLPHTLKPYGFA